MNNNVLPNGIVGVLQTPFLANQSIDWASLERLIEDAISSGADGFLAPAVASEVSTLSQTERTDLVKFIINTTNQRVPLIVGATSNTIEETKFYTQLAEETGACAYLIAASEPFYKTPSYFLPYLQMIAPYTKKTLIIQDLHWQGYGLPIHILAEIKQNLPVFRGIKIETVPAGPKYTQVRDEFGNDFYICGGWAVPQMLEAMDRGVNALMPECSMIYIYKKIWNFYQSGNRDEAKRLFHQLLPILSFTNQEINTSIAFFKRLLVKRGIFSSAVMRVKQTAWDEHSARIADELIDWYMNCHADCITQS